MMYRCDWYPYYGIRYVVEVKKWLRDNIGSHIPMHALEDNFDEGGFWFTKIDGIYFKEEKHAMLYTLRWL